MNKVNDTQVGGSHYQSVYQHWDFVMLVLQGRYLEGCVTKYVTRHRKKNGRQDLEKARHYLAKLRESQRYMAPLGWTLANSLTQRAFVTEQVVQFNRANELGEQESSVIVRVATWKGDHDLEVADSIIEQLLRDVYPQ